MEGMGIWIFLLLFYLLQALTKRKKKQQQQAEAESPKPQSSSIPRSSGELQRGKAPQRPKRSVSLADIFNPEKLREMLDVPQPEPVERPEPKPVSQPAVMHKAKPEILERWEEPQQPQPSLQHEEPRETVSRVDSADITNVDESVADFKSGRLGKSDITSDRFDVRKEAPGKKKKAHVLEYFDELEDIRKAVILKEILDRPRAFRRQIR